MGRIHDLTLRHGRFLMMGKSCIASVVISYFSFGCLGVFFLSTFLTHAFLASLVNLSVLYSNCQLRP